MNKFDYKDYKIQRDSLAKVLSEEPDKKMRKRVLKATKGDPRYWTSRYEKLKTRMGHGEALDKILKEIGIERDPNGKIILYHATLAKNLAGILEKDSLAPAQETGERVWRHSIETGEKEQKVYLASENKAEAIAGALQKQYGGSAFILEVHVDEDHLCPDEDTGTKNWFESLATEPLGNGNYGGSCSHKGSIKDFFIHKRLPYILPERRVFDYFEKAAGIPQEDQEALDALRVEQEKEKSSQALEENRFLNKYREMIERRIKIN